MKRLALITFLVLHWNVSAQDSLKWQLQYTLPLSESHIWTCDHFGQLYVAQKDLIKKFDVKGKLNFEQSLKKYGQITEIDAKNPMKILLFTEQQQLVFYLDNTLTKHAVELDLSDFGLSYATHAEGSVQPDKIWIFDQENSELSLLATREQQSIRLKNTAGLMNFSTVERILERDEYLYVVDSKNGLFQLDLYGTLINQFPLPSGQNVQIESSRVYQLLNDQLQIMNLLTGERKTVSLPISPVVHFEIKQNRIILESNGQIFHYLVELF